MFYGNNISKSEVFRISDLVRAEFPKQEIEIQEGCQPHYHFIIAIE